MNTPTGAHPNPNPNPNPNPTSEQECIQDVIPKKDFFDFDFGFAALGYVIFGIAIKKDKKGGYNRA